MNEITDTGTFGTKTVRVPRACIEDEVGKIRSVHPRTVPALRAVEAGARFCAISGTDP